MKLDVPDLAGTRRLARALAGLLRAGDLIILSGELGAGKTTFTQALGEQLGVRAGIISPTFVLVRIHPSLVGGPDLVHVDAYRLASAAEIDDIDLENTMDVSVTVVEWGELVRDFLVVDRLEAVLAFGAASDERMITLRSQGNEWADRLSALAPALKAFAAEVANP